MTHASFTPHFNAWRFYDSDAGEAASTALAAQDANHTLDIGAGNVSFQLRCRIDETGGADGNSTDDYQLQYNKNGTGYTNLTTTDSGDGIRAVAAGLTNDNATTNRASEPISDPGSGSFVAGEQSSDGLVDDMQLTANNFTEHVYGVELVAANLANGDNIDFQFSSPGGIVNNVTPRMSVTAPITKSLSFAHNATLTLSRKVSYKRTLNFSHVASLSLARAATYKRALAYVHNATLTLSPKIVFKQALSFAHTATLTLSSKIVFKQALSFAHTATLTLSRVVIPFVGGAVAMYRRFRGWRRG